MRIENRFIRYWLPVIVWCAIIFAQSAFATPDVVPSWPFLDKVLHTCVYGLLGAMLCRALNSIRSWQGRTVQLISTAALLTVLYGLSDEWHQSFVAARTAEAADVLADLTGGLIGSGLYLLIQRITRAHAKPSRIGDGSNGAPKVSK